MKQCNAALTFGGVDRGQLQELRQIRVGGGFEVEATVRFAIGLAVSVRTRPLVRVRLEVLVGVQCPHVHDFGFSAHVFRHHRHGQHGDALKVSALCAHGCALACDKASAARIRR